MKQELKYFLQFAFLLILCGCGTNTVSDKKEYLSYLANPENGLIKEKNVAGIKYKLKYLPEDYQVFNTMKVSEKLNERQIDSVRKAYANSVTFLLNIGPDENENFDITRVGISTYEEFADRIEQMAFGAQEWISIKIKDKEYHPDIVKLENINALEKSRNFIVVFSSEKNSEKDLRKNDMCFQYSDEMFDTGVNKFVFRAEDIGSIPEFKF
jgi:hypothetical protein